MPNHVANYVIITGKFANIKKFWKEATKSSNKEYNGKFCYDNLYPMPDGIDGMEWYEWAIKNWGNKWGCFDVVSNISLILSGTITLFYNTAWYYSTNFWLKVTNEHKIKVVNYFHDEGSNFCGKESYSKGLVTSKKLYDNYEKQKKYFVTYAEICGRENYYDKNNGDDENIAL